jgi:hypothetical protein
MDGNCVRRSFPFVEQTRNTSFLLSSSAQSAEPEEPANQRQRLIGAAISIRRAVESLQAGGWPGQGLRAPDCRHGELAHNLALERTRPATRVVSGKPESARTAGRGTRARRGKDDPELMPAKPSR